MIKASDAIRAARSLIGTPYAQLDCINLIKKVIRTAPGGVPGYTTAGTNALWDSINMSAKYRDLTERHEGIEGIPAGALPFKRYGTDDEGHVGIATGEGTVIHSSSVKGKVVETPLTAAEGWDCWGVHRYIETSSVGFADAFPKGEGLSAEESEGGTMAVLYRARVNTSEDPLNVRDYPKTGRILGKVAKGKIVDVVSEKGDGWVWIVFNELVGYASAEYLERIEEAQEETAQTDEGDNVIRVETDITIIDSAGNRFKPVGDFRVLFGSID